MDEITDPILKSTVKTLRIRSHCHTIILFGARARGLATSKLPGNMLAFFTKLAPMLKI
jgi:hypothetical protein